MRNPVIFGMILSLASSSAISWAAINSSGKTLDSAHGPVASDILNKKKKKKKGKTTREAQAPVAGAPAIKSAGAPLIPAAPHLAPSQNVNLPPAVISTPVSTVKSSTQKSRFSFRYRSYNAEDLSAIENSTNDREVRAWDRFNFSYHVTDNVSIDLMPQVFHTWFGDRDRPQDPDIPSLKQPYAGYMGDTGLYLVDSKLAEFKNGVVLEGYTSFLFFPTSEASQKAGQIGYTRTSLDLGRSFGKLDVKWTEMIWYYFQQYQTASFDSNSLPVQNLDYRMWSLLDLDYNVTKKFAINFEGGFMNESKFADTNVATYRPEALADYIIFNPELAYAITENFSLSLGIWEQYNMRSPPVTMTDATGKIPTQWVSQYTPLASYNPGTEGYLMTTMKF